MNLYSNEEVAWQRLVDLQREAEYSRYMATRGLPWLVHAAVLLGGAVWKLAGRALRRAPRRSPVAWTVTSDDDDVASHVA